MIGDFLVLKKMRGGRTHQLMSVALMATAAIGPMVLAPAASAQATGERNFNIPAQSLGDALVTFGIQSGMQVTTNGVPLRGVQTGGVKGNLAPAQALSQLLAGSGFTFRINGNVVTLERAPQTADGSIQLGPVRVEGATGTSGNGYGDSLTSDRLATEGTRSYAPAGASIMKGGKSLLDIPQSVTVVTRQRIDDQNLITLTDVMSNVTGVAVDPRVGGGADFYSRGFQMSSVQFDGVPTYRSTMPSGNTFSASTAYVDRVEVLRGSQGLLEGQGTPGGAVNLVRKRGTFEPQISYTARAGSWNHFGGIIDVGAPLNDAKTLRVRAVAEYDRQDSFIDIVNSKRFTGYLALDYDFDPDTRFGMAASIGRKRSVLDEGLPHFSDGSNPHLPRSTFYGAEWSYNDVDEEQYWADLEHSFNSNWSLKIAGNYSKSRAHELYLTPDNSVSPTATTVARDVWKTYDGTRTFGIDAHVDGQFNLGQLQNEIMVGGSISRLHSIEHLAANFGAYPTDLYNPEANIPEPTSYSWSTTYLFQPIIQKGVYGMVRSTLGPATLILGTRVNWYKAVRATSTFSQDGVVVPYAGLVYKLTPQWSAYASYTDVFNPQRSLQANGDVLPPVRGKSYEAGIKGELADGRLTTSLALFRTDQVNLAVTDVASGEICGGNYCYLPSGKVRSQGIEVEVNGEVLPGLQLSGGYTYNHMEHIEDFASFISPKHMLRLWADYRLPSSLSAWSLGAGVRYQSAQERNGFRNSPYTVVSAKIGYALNEQFDLSLNVDNLLDETYFTTVGRDYYGSPRNFMLTLRGKI
ncbi:MAG: TonB-dependent siderophore receptor [Sphingobium sp.]|nr:TonB-dependent siderophore receptor [Sphingobium sp.]